MLKLSHDENAHSADLFEVLSRLGKMFDIAYEIWDNAADEGGYLYPMPVSAHGNSKE